MPKKSPVASSSKSVAAKKTAAASSDRETPRRAQPDTDRAADVGESEGIVTMVCITCGAEQFFDDRIPARLTCKACAGTVFRQFATPAIADEATLDQPGSEARSIQYGDSSPETTTDDVRDLDQGR